MRGIRSSFVLAACAFGATQAAGCAGSVDGDIDGDHVSPIISAFFGTATVNKAHVTQVVGVSWMTSCEKVTTWFHDRDKTQQHLFESDQQSSDRDRFAEDMADTDKEVGLPNDAWQLSLFSVGENAIEDDDDFKAKGEISVALVHQTEAPDYDEWARKGADPSVDAFVAIDGRITFDKFDDSSAKISSDEIDWASNDDVIEHGADDADSVGSGHVSLSAGFCPDLSDYLDELFKPLENPGEGEGSSEGEGEGVGPTCSISDDCPNVACICDDGSAIGSPVNTRNCVNDSCQTPAQECPSSCSSFGMPWTGQADVGTVGEGEGEGSSSAQEGTCDGFIGAGDGCDCGCGQFDSDCPSTSGADCGFNECESGTPDPNNNAFCI